jgi:integrase
MAKPDGIYQRKLKSGDITYYLRFRYAYRDEATGETRLHEIKEKLGRKSRGFTRAMAREALNARLGEVAQGRFNLDKARKPHSLGELVERYLKHAESYKASYTREKYAIEGLRNHFGAATHLSNITVWGCEKWKRARAKSVQPSTVNRELTVLKHILKMAVKWELASVNPAAGVSPFPTQEGRIRFASEQELPLLLEACRNEVTSPWLYPLVVLALHTGARQGELLQLRWEDLDLERGLIYFNRTKNRKLKTVPMNRPVREAIEWLSNHRYGEHLFMWPWGEEIGRTTVYDAFKKACQTAGVEGFRFHDLRHTAASYLVMSGVDLPTVKELLGHREIEMTLRYSHLAPTHKAKAVEQLGRALEQITQGETAANAQASGEQTVNLERFGNISLVRKGRGLVPLGQKTEQEKPLTGSGEWWRRGESNPRPKVFHQI